MSNIREYSRLQYRIDKNIDGTVVCPKIFLMTRTLKKITQIYPHYEFSIVPKFNEPNDCSFTLHQINNGIELPYWDRIKDLSVILVEGFGLFQIKVSVIENEVVTKKITGQSLQNCELGQILGSWEINTTDDIKGKVEYDDDESATVFYRPISGQLTELEEEQLRNTSLIHRILSYAPHYEIGHIDDSLWDINREFSASNTSVYDFMQTVADEIGCIFICDPFSRVVNVFDMEDHCTNPSCTDRRHIFDGVCQGCHSSDHIEKGYGKDVTTYIDTTNIVEELEDTVNADGIKNCVKIVGGDDAITNQIGQRLIGNSNCIWTFSDEQIEEMSKPLQEKWKGYASYVASFQDDFNDYWDERNKLSKEKLYEESGKMPIIETNSAFNNDNPTQRCKEIYDNIVKKITYASIGHWNTSLYTLSKKILAYAQLLVPEGYKVKYQQINKENDTKCDYNSDSAISKWYGKLYVYLLDAVDESTGDDKYYYAPTSYWILPVEPGYKVMDGDNFSNSYYKWMKQQLDIQLQDDTKNRFQPKYDTDYSDGVSKHLKDADYYKNYFAEYSRNRLQSFHDAYVNCSVIIEDLSSDYSYSVIQRKFNYIVNDNGTISNKTLFDALMEKYRAFTSYISELMSISQEKIDKYVEQITELDEKIDEINRQCSPETYFGDLYKELMMFKREDVYENNNFVADSVSEDNIIPNIEELILDARQEVARACQSNHSVNVQLGNILSANSFSDQIEYIALGNYIRTRVQGVLTKMRIIEMSLDFDNIESSDITFSDAIVGYQPIKEVKSKLDKAASMATSFDFVAKQSTRNDKKVSEFNKLFNDGLSAANTLIKSNDKEEFVIDNYGILGRQWDNDTETYDDCQLRVTHNVIGFTTKNWDTLEMAIGKITWNSKSMYGVIADALIGRMLIGESLEISNDNNTYTMDNNGFHIVNGNNKIELNAEKSEFYIEKDGDKLFSYSPDNGLYIKGNGEFSGIISGGKINIGNNFSVDENGVMKCDSGTFKGTIDATKGNIGGWEISEYGMKSNKARYFTTISNSEEYKLDGIHYQTTIRDGKIICGVEDKDSLPNTDHGYTDVSPAGVFCKLGNLPNKYNYLFAADAINKCVFMNNNIYLKTNTASGGITPLLGLSVTNNIHIGDYEDNFIASNCFIHAANIYKATSSGYTSLSDSRYKTDIQEISNGIELIKSLNPVKYKFTDGTSDRFHFGFLAQDVEKSLKETTGDSGVLVKYTLDDSGEIDLDDESTYVCGLRYEELIAPLVSCIQDLYEENSKLRQGNEKLLGSIQELTERIEALEA